MFISLSGLPIIQGELPVKSADWREILINLDGVDMFVELSDYDKKVLGDESVAAAKIVQKDGCQWWTKETTSFISRTLNKVGKCI